MSKIVFFTASTIVLISIIVVINRFAYSSRPSDQVKLLSNYHHLDHAEAIPTVGAVGPESFTFDPLGEGPYTGVSDGRIIKWQGNERGWIDFAVTSPEREGCQGGHDHDQTEHICGRPLGLRFNEKTGDLYISDAYMGLLVVGPNGGLPTKLATQAKGLSFGFTNGLDIDLQSGVVYFSDSSSVYPRRNYISVILGSDNTGRLMKYDPESKQVNILLDNLSFPNGVGLSKDGNFILVAETTKCRILRYWLEPTKAGTYEVFADLPGFPDNIKRNKNGEFWVGLHSRRTKLVELVLSYPWIGKALLKLPFNPNKLLSISAKWRGGGLAMRLSEEGEVLEVLEDKSGSRWMSISEVEELDGKLWIGSVNMPYAVRRASRRRSSPLTTHRHSSPHRRSSPLSPRSSSTTPIFHKKLDEKEWTIALYHGGEFQDIPHKSYVGGELGNFDHISYDYMLLFVFWEMAEKLKKYPEPRMCKFYYRLPGLPLKEGLRAIESDADVLKMLESHMRLPIITAFLVAPQPEPLDQLEPPLALDQFINDAHEEDCEMRNADDCDMGTVETTEPGLNTVEEEPQVNVPDPMFEYDSTEENCVDDETRDKNDDEDWVEQKEVNVTKINFGDREEDQRVDSDLEDLIDIGIT